MGDTKKFFFLLIFVSGLRIMKNQVYREKRRLSNGQESMYKVKSLFIVLLVFTTFTIYGTPVGQVPDESNSSCIYSQLICQAPPVDATTGQYIDFLNPISRDSFTPREDVWIAVDRNLFKDKMCAAVYIVDHRNDWDRKNIENVELIDVSGESEIIDLSSRTESIIYENIWKKPSCRIGSYDVVIDFEPIGQYDKGQDIVDNVKGKGFSLPEHWVYLESITFNYDKRRSEWDAINIRKNWNTSTQREEWMHDISSPAVYIKDRIVKIKATFISSPFVKNAYIQARKRKGPLGDAFGKTIEFEMDNKYNIKRGEAFFEVDDRTPNKIIKECQLWRWLCSGIILENGKESYIPMRHIGDSINNIFIILALPQSPWYQYEERAPWSDVLEYSCLWADGATNPVDAAKKITQNLYSKTGLSYNRNPSCGGSATDSFNLDIFLKKITLPHIEKGVNCFDMGKALVTFSNVVGCGLTYMEIDSKSRNVTFNSFQPLGCDQNDIRGDSFEKHALGSIDCCGILLYDACFKYPELSDSNGWLSGLPWETFQRSFDPNTEYILSSWRFFINKRIIEENPIDKASREMIISLKDQYKMNWIDPGPRVIAGLGISDEILEPLKNLEQVVENENFAIEKIRGSTAVFVTVQREWKSENSRLITTMVVGPSATEVVKYMILRSLDNSRGIPEWGFRSDIGNICLVLPAQPNDEYGYSQLEFIQNNVLIFMEAKGEIRKKLKNMGETLSELLKNQKDDFRTNNIPDLTFKIGQEVVEPGSFLKLSVNAENQKKIKSQYLWEMTGGGIEKNNSGDWTYYAADEGIHTITVILVNELGLYSNVSRKIKVWPDKQNNIK